MGAKAPCRLKGALWRRSAGIAMDLQAPKAPANPCKINIIPPSYGVMSPFQDTMPPFKGIMPPSEGIMPLSENIMPPP